MQQGFVRGGPRLLLRIEGLAYAVLALIGYAHGGYSWWLFAALILVPDVSMLGYRAARCPLYPQSGHRRRR